MFDALFAPWQMRAGLSEGKPDGEFRDPGRVLDVLSAQGLLPPPARTITVTGSKGKGSVARLLAWNLQSAGFRVGLLLSPQERDHCDRIRVNNRPIGHHAVEALRDALSRMIADLMEVGSGKERPGKARTYYPSPHALFLALGLMEFRRQRVDYWVLECGRGARYDEVGGLRAGIGIVTSVLEEHCMRLGNTGTKGCWSGVAEDKLFIADSTDRCLLMEDLASRLRKEGMPVPDNADQVAIERSGGQSDGDGNVALVRHALQVLGVSRFRHWPLPSSGEIETTLGCVAWEGRVNRASPARFELEDRVVVLALTADKDWHGLAQQVPLGQRCWLFLDALDDTPRWQAHYAGDRCVGHLPPGEAGVAMMRSTLDTLQRAHGRVLLWGVQLALVSLRLAFDVALAGPVAEA